MRAADYRNRQWWLTTDAGEEPFDVLVTATGMLRIPRYPDISGVDTSPVRYEDLNAAMPQTGVDDGLHELVSRRGRSSGPFPWLPKRHRELLRTPEVSDFDVRLDQL